MRILSTIILLIFTLTLSAQVPVDSVNVLKGSEVPTSSLFGDELVNFLQGPVGARRWKKISANELRQYTRPCADTLYRVQDTVFLKNTDCDIFYIVNSSSNNAEPSLEQFINQSGNVVTVAGTLPTTNRSKRIRVVRGGIELILNEDYTIINNDFNFLKTLDGENVKIWY